jgi:hypothetical protein
MAEPRAEAEDAFEVGDWDRSVCPGCGNTHREVLFAFPPAALLNRFVAKARADGVRAVVVTPLAVSAPYWTKLLRASVVSNADGYLLVRRQQAASSDSDAAGELAIFAVDFSPWSARSRALPDAPCGNVGRFRGRDPRGSPPDIADRALIRAELVALGLAFRCAEDPPPPLLPLPPFPLPPPRDYTHFDPSARRGPSGPPMDGFISWGTLSPVYQPGHGDGTSPLYTAVTATATSRSNPVTAT